MEGEPIMTLEEFEYEVRHTLLTDSGQCPVTPVVLLLQGKWKLQIIYGLFCSGTVRFGEFKKMPMLQGITNTMLTNALKDLIRDGIISREQFNEIPPHVEYSLTEKGKDLLPVFYSIAQFGLKYIK